MFVGGYDHFKMITWSIWRPYNDYKQSKHILFYFWYFSQKCLLMFVHCVFSFVVLLCTCVWCLYLLNTTFWWKWLFQMCYVCTKFDIHVFILKVKKKKYIRHFEIYLNAKLISQRICFWANYTKQCVIMKLTSKNIELFLCAISVYCRPNYIV